MLTGAIYERAMTGRLGALILYGIQARVRRMARSFEVVGRELRRIPSYHDEAERIMRGLRRDHANGRGRDGANFSDD